MRHFCAVMAVFGQVCLVNAKMSPMITELGRSRIPRECRAGEVAPVCVWCYMDRFLTAEWECDVR